MKYTIPQLRAMPQINWQVPHEWMTKMTNEEIKEWEDAAILEAEEFIKNDKRATEYSEDVHKFRREVVGIVNDKARILDRDYKLLTIG